MAGSKEAPYQPDISPQQVQIFTSADGQAQLQVALEQDTLWLSQAQMGELFDTTPENVLMHLKNIFNDGELAEPATTKDFLVVRREGARQVRRRIKHYSLDAIISVGYRVSSRRATQFRQWATRVLQAHLVEGYTLNQRRLAERGIEFEQAVSLLSRTLANQQLVNEQGRAVLQVIGDYAKKIKVPTPMFDASKPVYIKAMKTGYGAQDTAAVCAVMEKAAKIKRGRR